jgi:hypothetical protein
VEEEVETEEGDDPHKKRLAAVTEDRMKVEQLSNET